MATATTPPRQASGSRAELDSTSRAAIFRTLWLRALRDIRGRTIAFAYLFAAVAYINPVSYRHAYPTAADRIDFAHTFGHNQAVVLFYGKAYNLLTIGGYTAWRSGGILAIFAAVFGMMAAVRLTRTNEDTGQAELVLSGLVSRGMAGAALLSAIVAVTVVLWLAMLAGLLAAGLGVGGSAFLALSTVTMVPVFAGVGALTGQLASNRRLALELGGAAVVAAFLLRVIADTASGLSWLDWLTPLGWAERMRPFTGARPAVLLPALAFVTCLAALVWRLQASRDVGTGWLSEPGSREPRLALLGSPAQQALRRERSSLTAWLLGTGGFALIVGVISKSVSSAGISKQLSNELSKLGAGPVLQPVGYLSFTFIFFVFVVSLFAVSQIAAARHEEADGQLETVLSTPVARWRWLVGRLLLAVAAMVVLALVAGLLTWLGAISQGVSVSAWRMLQAAANCLPPAVLFLGLAALAFAVLPRATAGIGYALVVIAFLWQLFGSLLGAPHWLVDATPFAHLGLAPVHSFRPGPAGVMLSIGLVAAAGAVAAFRHRDVIGS